MDMAYVFDMKARYTVIDNGKCSEVYLHLSAVEIKLLRVISECGGEFVSLSGEIASPDYPSR